MAAAGLNQQRIINVQSVRPMRGDEPIFESDCQYRADTLVRSRSCGFDAVELMEKSTMLASAAHADDACQCDPAKMAPKVVAKLTGAPDNDSMTVLRRRTPDAH